MQCIIQEVKVMSFNFGSNNINQFKAQSAYKDGSGMGGGGMYFQQERKRKDQPEEDLFESKDEKKDNEIGIDVEISEKDIPMDTLFNKFVNWFNKDNK